MAAAAGEQLSFDSALAATLQDLKLSFSLRNEQRTALKSFLEKKDVFRVLPTGYSKSLIYQLAPLVGKRMGLCHSPLNPPFATLPHGHFRRSDYVTFFVARIGCSAILLRAEGT